MKLRKSQIAFLIFAIIAYAAASTLNVYTENQRIKDAQQETAPMESPGELVNASDGFSLPEYEGNAWTVMNDNVPYMDGTDFINTYVMPSEMDALGRCGIAEAVLGPDTLPEGERGEIGHVKPSGWHTVKYNSIVDGNYLYNRCHLIAWSLSGLNDDERNLITGTRYLNIQGMWTYEEKVLDYIRDTGNKVHYRSSPIFMDDELVARGVLLEACSEDGDLTFCVFLHNVQPGIEIDYATGESNISPSSSTTKTNHITP